jgi:FixJ family two-component response regulator
MPLEKEMVAVVENDSTVGEAIARLLRAAGFRAQTFLSAESFLKGETLCNAACLVIDIHLGGMSGFDLEQRLTDSGSHVPVIFITADETPETRERAKGTNCRALLNKPVEATMLIPIVREAMEPPPLSK